MEGLVNVVVPIAVSIGSDWALKSVLSVGLYHPGAVQHTCCTRAQGLVTHPVLLYATVVTHAVRAESVKDCIRWF